jgi:hypothetical protein
MKDKGEEIGEEERKISAVTNHRESERGETSEKEEKEEDNNKEDEKPSF